MDYNKIAALEHQIAQKYGHEAVQHPGANWDTDDEVEFKKQVDKLYNKFESFWKEKAYTNKSGYLISKKLLIVDGDVESCESCNKYKIHFTSLDDINIGRYGCCYDCYVKYVEDREERWINGWRPKSSTDGEA